MTGKKDFLNLIWYDKKKYKIPIPKKSYWFHDERGASHCTVMCRNESTVFYVTDHGLAKIAYCEPDATERILKTMLTGSLERGIWCTISSGRLRPHDYYQGYMPYMKKSNPIQAKKLQKKIDLIRNLVKNVRGRSRNTKRRKCL